MNIHFHILKRVTLSHDARSRFFLQLQIQSLTTTVVVVVVVVVSLTIVGSSSASPVSVYAGLSDSQYRAPQPAHYSRDTTSDDYATPAKYNFAYDVSNAYTGDYKSQTEERNGDYVKGQYTVVEPDGTKRVVDYTADGQNGFNAVVSKEGHVAPVSASNYAAAAPVYKTPAAPVYRAAPALVYRAAPGYSKTYKQSAVSAAYRPAPAAIYQDTYTTDATDAYPTTAATYPSTPLYKSAYRSANKQPSPSYYSY